VYIAANLDAAAQDEDCRAIGVLSAAAKWAGKGELPMKTDCPPSVEVITLRKRGEMGVLLIRGTSNHRCSNSVRHVVPISDANLEVRTDAKPKQLHPLSGQNKETRYKSGRLDVAFKTLKEYEGISIDF
jgi:hypothetical protein